MVRIEVLSIIALVISLLVAVLTPSIPALSAPTVISIIIILFFIVLIAIFVWAFQEIGDRIDATRKENLILKEELKEVKNRISILEQTFKSFQDLSDLRTSVKVLERRVFKR